MSIKFFSLSWLCKALSLIAVMAVLVDPLAAHAAQITEHIDEARLTRLQGNSRHDLNTAEDQGALNDSQRLPNLHLTLKRSAPQEFALAKLMTEQLDPASAHFHRWLTPAEFGAYGPSDADLQTLTQWLQAHGFTVQGANIGRTFLRFSGSVAAVNATFHTNLHRYLVRGEPHVANDIDPSIPSALNAIVTGVHLSDFQAKPLHHHIGAVDLARKTGRSMAETPSVVTHPLNDPTGTAFKLVAPYDFAAIYNVLPLWNAGIDGTGQSIAIAGRSDINLTDVAAFRAAFGLPAKAPTIIVNGTDPGIPSSEDKVENSLDVEWSGAIAKNAQIIFVTTASIMSDGAAESALYIIDHQTAPVMSFSYGACELLMGAEGNAFYDSMWQQAAAEGISVFVAAGDQGSAACDDGAAPPGATHGLAVSGISSTPYNTAVGGTDFNWENLPNTTYWSGSNDATGASALGYIPEVPWNSTCASLAIDQLIGLAGAGFDQEQTCQYLINNNYDTYLVGVAGGGGGPSNCTTASAGTMQSCAGGYAKPSWQTGAGVPADGQRDVPDVSLFAANGALGNAYAICDSDSAPCDYAVTNDAFAQAIGGTSVASPAMAGIMALVNQKMGSPQGNANAALYALAGLDYRASCASGTVASGNSCNFYDIASDDNAVPCTPGSPNCVVHHSGDTVGILAGYTATAGYDLATGLGSINANNLINNWHLATAAGTVSVPSVTGLTQAAASSALNAAGLALGSVTAQSSNTVASGLVLAESPAASTSVTRNSSVNLTLSSGPALVAVPPVVGLTQSSAIASIMHASLVAGPVTTEASATILAGVVMSQSPVAGSSVAAASGVSLVVSSGPVTTVVAAVVGLTQAAATSALTAASLTVGTISAQSSATVAAGEVISQSPAEGTKVAKASKVNLVISTGPALVVTPKVVGLTKAKATAVLQNAGEVLGAVSTAASALPAGEVISQSPLANAKVARGSAVRLVISTGK